MRPLLSPTFTGSKMKVMFQLMNEVAASFIDYHKNMKGDGIIEVEMKDSLTRYGNDVIASVIFGVKVDSLNDKDNEFYKMGKKATNFGTLKFTIKMLGYASFPKLYSVSEMYVFLFFFTSIFNNIIVKQLSCTAPFFI